MHPAPILAPHCALCGGRPKIVGLFEPSNGGPSVLYFLCTPCVQKHGDGVFSRIEARIEIAHQAAAAAMN